MMVTPDNTNWLFDYGFIEDISASDGNFSVSASGFSWPVQAFNNDAEIDGLLRESGSSKETGSKQRSEARRSSSSKACREKLRRDRLNDKYMELASLIEPGNPPKTDKAAILIDAIRGLTQLRCEAQKWKESNLDLEEKIRELKDEKNEFREEKQRLNDEKERLEHKLKKMKTQPGFSPPPAIPATFSAQGLSSGNKLVPIIGYSGVAMWQFMPPAVVDTSQDHMLHPPVA